MPCAKCFGEIDEITHLDTPEAIYELCQSCTDEMTDWIEKEVAIHDT